jgi:DNA-binding transcriptional LysR family regulator
MQINVEQIKKIWFLHLVTEEGSLRGAALRAKVTPSAISQAISSLEAGIGQRVLIRRKGAQRSGVDQSLESRVEITSMGRSLLDQARPAFEILASLSATAPQQVPRISWMNLGTYESLAIDLLPGLIRSFREKSPDMRIGLRVARTPQLLQDLRQGELCAAIVTEFDDIDKFYTREIGEDRLGVFVANTPEFREQGWKSIDRKGVGSLLPGRNGLPRYFTKFLRAYDLAKPFFLSESFETLRAAAVSGATAAVLPEMVALRTPGQLIEIHPPQTQIGTQGRHRILVIGQKSCDREEIDFVAAEANSLMNWRSRKT